MALIDDADMKVFNWSLQTIKILFPRNSWYNSPTVGLELKFSGVCNIFIKGDTRGCS